MAQVTIGLPVYNGEKYLDQALESLCSQTFHDLKIIISDNCSTDKTPEILKKWAFIDSRITLVYRQKQNIGALSNFEWVLKQSDSPWFMFAAHDDKWTPNYVERLYKYANQNKETKLCVPYVVYTDEEGTNCGFREYPEDIDQLKKMKRIKKLLKYCCGSWFYGIWNREFLLESWENNKDFSYPWGQDLLIILPSLLTNKVVGCNTVQYICRTTDLSAKNYKPKGYSNQKNYLKQYLKKSFLFLKKSELGYIEKVILLPYIIQFVNNRGFKFRRLVRSAFKDMIGKAPKD